MTSSPSQLNEKVIEANIALHAKLASQYRTNEPHFRPENVLKVERRLSSLVEETQATDLLDLGCGTGFMIDIAKRYVRRIVGVDATKEMLEQVNLYGPATIELVQQDTGAYNPTPERFQVVTAYSFLHHLYDLRPTCITAFRSLVSNGKFYADLEPNKYFWDGICQLERTGTYHPLVRREIEAVSYKDEEIEKRFGVPRETFNYAEFGKDIAGGFQEENLRQLLSEVGFRHVDFHYHWFLGEGFIINRDGVPRELSFEEARLTDEALQRALPISRNLFKYLGFVATK